MGIDLVKTERVKTWDQSTILDKYFSSVEQELISSVQGARRNELMAGRFAVKEAVLKAFRLGINMGVHLNEIETQMAEDGAPVLVFKGKAKEYVYSMGIEDCSVSISHDAGLTTAVVILV